MDKKNKTVLEFNRLFVDEKEEEMSPVTDDIDTLKIKEIIEDLRIYVRLDGGDFKFIKYENGVVFIEILGACVGCSLIDVTYRDGLLNILKKEVPSVKDVVIVENKSKGRFFFPF